MASGILKPSGSAVGVRIYSNDCAAGGGVPAVALFSRQGTELMVLPNGAAGQVLAGSPMGTNEIFGLEAFAKVAAVVALGEQLGGRRMILPAGHSAAAGALFKAPSRVQVIAALIEGV